MEWRIRRTMFIVAFLAALAAIFLSATAFFDSFKVQVQKDVQLTARLIAVGYRDIGSIYDLSRYADESLRLTLINDSGTVLYESENEADAMVNQLELPEVAEALTFGSGQSIRMSDTSDEDNYFYALKLYDNNVLRVSVSTSSMFMMFISAYSQTAMMVVVMLIAMAVTASVLVTRSIVRPLDTLAAEIDRVDPDDGSGSVYKELVPFVREIKTHRAEQARLAEEKSRMAQIWRDYAMNVSHELKTPLTSISGYSELLSTGGLDASTSKRFGEIIHRESDRMLSIISNVIFQAQVEASGADGREEIDLLEMAEECVDALSLHAEAYEVKLTVGGEPTVISGDREQIESLIINLCDNAIRYNVRGGTACVTVGKGALTVEDTGIGIAPEHHSKLFERFYRVDKSRSRATGGTGLGLSIVRSIAERHNAKILLESAEGKGTKITVNFPSFT